MKRWLKTFLILVAFFLLPMLWLLFSHVMAKRGVEGYKAQLRAAGEKLTIDDWLPPRIPPEQNAAKLFLQAYPYLDAEGAIDSNPPPAMQIVAPGKAMIGWQQLCIVSRNENRTITNTWNDIEQDLKGDAPGLELLHQAAAYPEIDFGVDYHSSTGLPLHITRMKWAALLLTAATVSDLNRGKTPSAVTNLHTALTLVNQWRNERIEISQWVRYSMTAIVTGAQWEVLQERNVTDSELAMLQHDWDSMEFIQPLASVFEMQRALEISNIQDLRTSNSPSAVMGAVASSGAGTSNTSSWSLKNFGHAAARKTSDILWRTSWSYRDELHALQAQGVLIETMRQIETNGFFKDALAKKDLNFKMLQATAEGTNWFRHRLDDRLANLFGDFGSHTGTRSTVFDRMMSLEGTRRIVIVAIALKRYQLQHGTWPADLKTLVPQFLSEVPRDPVDGLPLRYRTNADGHLHTLFHRLRRGRQRRRPFTIREQPTLAARPRLGLATTRESRRNSAVLQEPAANEFYL